jgi:hypothetical protein
LSPPITPLFFPPTSSPVALPPPSTSRPSPLNPSALDPSTSALQAELARLERQERIAELTELLADPSTLANPAAVVKLKTELQRLERQERISELKEQLAEKEKQLRETAGTAAEEEKEGVESRALSGMGGGSGALGHLVAPVLSLKAQEDEAKRRRAVKGKGNAFLDLTMDDDDDE